MLIGSGLSGHTWSEDMVRPLEERIVGAIPAERRRAYRDGTNDEVLDEDVETIADAHARYMVAGPGRDPGAVDAAVWAMSMSMLRQVFRREWTEHPVQPGPPAAPASTRLGEVSVPTVIVNGLADVPALQQVADLLTAGIPDARRIDLTDTGHLAPLERPAQVSAAVSSLLQQRATP